MVDTDLIIQVLKDRGHVVDSVVSIPDNAGGYEFMVDGNVLTLAEVRGLLEMEEPRQVH